MLREAIYFVPADTRIEAGKSVSNSPKCGASLHEHASWLVLITRAPGVAAETIPHKWHSLQVRLHACLQGCSEGPAAGPLAWVDIRAQQLIRALKVS